MTSSLPPRSSISPASTLHFSHFAGLGGATVGVTAARKVEEQVGLLERRGARVAWAPALSTDPNRVDQEELLAATRAVLARPVDLFLATTGVGMKAWFQAAQDGGLYDDLVAALGPAEIIARGPKSVGVLRRHGLREDWAPSSECFDDVLAHLADRDLTGRRIVVQEHGQSLSTVADALRRRGAVVTVVTVYRVLAAEDPTPLLRLVDRVAEHKLDAVTFTSAPAVAATMRAAERAGRRDQVVEAFRDGVLAVSVGPVTAAAFDVWEVPTIFPERSRLAAMVQLLDAELAARRITVAVEVGGRCLELRDGGVRLDGGEVSLSPAPLAVLRALATQPGHVVSRAELLDRLPSGQATSEHAVEVAVSRLRAAIGSPLVQTVVKRGYRLPVG